MPTYFDSNGFKIHYVEEGTGDPVLLLHGFSASVAMQWKIPGVAEMLAREYRVIAMDFRGHGKSDKPHDPAHYGVHLARDAVRLLDHLQVPKAHVVGYSMGGRVALKIAAEHPDRLYSATIGGMGVVGEETVLPPAQVRLAESLERGEGIKPLLLDLHPKDRPPPTEERLESANHVYMRNQDQKALAAVVRSVVELSVSKEQLQAHRVPTLAIIGEEDPFKRKVDVMSQLIPDLKVEVIPGNHMSAFGRPEFKQRLRAFLATQRQPASKGA